MDLSRVLAPLDHHYQSFNGCWLFTAGRVTPTNNRSSLSISLCVSIFECSMQNSDDEHISCIRAKTAKKSIKTIQTWMHRKSGNGSTLEIIDHNLNSSHMRWRETNIETELI